MGFLWGTMVWKARQGFKLSPIIKELGEEIINFYEDGVQERYTYVFRGQQIWTANKENKTDFYPLQLNSLNEEEKIYIRDCIKKATAKKIIYSTAK